VILSLLDRARKARDRVPACSFVVFFFPTSYIPPTPLKSHRHFKPLKSQISDFSVALTI
jgi:hypothetical protein